MKFKNLLLVFALLPALILTAQIPSYVPINGLKGYWPFTGNANDLSGNNYNGTVFGSVLTTDRFGNAGSAYQFNGISNYILTNYSGILGANPRAISFWARSSETVKSSYQVAWGGNQAGERFGTGFYSPGSPIAHTTIGGAFTNLTYNTVSPVSDGNWHHYVFQFGGSLFSHVQIYQDAVLLTQVIASTASNTPVNTASGFKVQFGRIDYTPGMEYYNGDLDEIGIWDRVLTLCEIKQLYKSALPSISVSGPTVTVCAGESVTLTATGGSSYTWSPQQQTSSSIVVTADATATYSVSGLVDGCLAGTAVSMIVETCTGIHDVSQQADRIHLFPNPSWGVLTVAGIQSAAYVEIYNVFGELVQVADVSKDQPRLDISAQAKGIYVLRVSTNTGITTRRVLKD